MSTKKNHGKTQINKTNILLKNCFTQKKLIYYHLQYLGSIKLYDNIKTCIMRWVNLICRLAIDLSFLIFALHTCHYTILYNKVHNMSYILYAL